MHQSSLQEVFTNIPSLSGYETTLPNQEKPLTWPYQSLFERNWREQASLFSVLNAEPIVFTAPAAVPKADIKLVLDLSGEATTGVDTNVICINDLTLLRNYKAILGDKCQVMVRTSKTLPEQPLLNDALPVMPVLKKENISEISEEIKQAMRALPPHFEWLKLLELALTNQDKIPKAIDRKFVHKNLKENVLISQPQKTGNLYWFNMFESSPEFQFDHESDHIQGMLLMEGLRQASIAAVHHVGLALEGTLALLSFNMDFFSYVDHGYPVLIRSFPQFDCDIQNSEPLALVISQVFQKGRLCAQATVSGQAFISKKDYETTRERTQKIIDRQTKKFEQKLQECII